MGHFPYDLLDGSRGEVEVNPVGVVYKTMILKSNRPPRLLSGNPSEGYSIWLTLTRLVSYSVYSLDG